MMQIKNHLIIIKIRKEDVKKVNSVNKGENNKWRINNN